MMNAQDAYREWLKRMPLPDPLRLTAFTAGWDAAKKDGADLLDRLLGIAETESGGCDEYCEPDCALCLARIAIEKARETKVTP